MELQNENTSKAQEISSLTGQLKQIKEQLERLNNDLLSLQKEKQEKMTELAELQVRFNTLNLGSDQLRSSLTASELKLSELDKLMKDNSDLHAKCSLIENQLEHKDSEIQNCHDQLNGLKQSNLRELSSMNDQLLQKDYLLKEMEKVKQENDKLLKEI